MATRTRVTEKQLARELARRHGVTDDVALEMLQSVCESLRDHLKAGQTVEVGNLFTLAYAGGPELREDESGGFSAYAPSHKELEVVPLGTLKEDLEDACNSAIYYVSNSSGDFVDLLTNYFGRRGWQLIHKRSGAEMSERMGQQPPVAMIFEGKTDGWQDLVRELKCDPRTNAVPIVGIFPDETQGAPITRITVQPDEVIYEPFDFSEFRDTAGAELASRVTAPTHDVTELELHLPGNAHQRKEARTIVEEVLYRCGLPETFSREAGEALSEALDNAWRHGHQLLDCCTIVLRVILDPKRLVMAIRDSGEGFDHAAAVTAARGRRSRTDDALAKAAAALRTRRGDMAEGGIARMLKVVDRLDFNRAGNELVLTKKRTD